MVKFYSFSTFSFLREEKKREITAHLVGETVVDVHVRVLVVAAVDVHRRGVQHLGASPGGLYPSALNSIRRPSRVNEFGFWVLCARGSPLGIGPPPPPSRLACPYAWVLARVGDNKKSLGLEDPRVFGILPLGLSMELFLGGGVHKLGGILEVMATKKKEKSS